MLATRGYQVTGLDVSEPSLQVARRHDSTGTVDYRCGDAYKLEDADGAYDAVCAMDFLEHVENPRQVVKEAARVLRPDAQWDPRRATSPTASPMCC